MRSQLRFITGLALSLCVTLAMVGDSEAFWKKLRERKEKQKPQQEQRNSNTFAASGICARVVETPETWEAPDAPRQTPPARSRR